MDLRLRHGARIALGILLGAALLLGVVGRGAARTADAPTVSIAAPSSSVAEGGTAVFPLSLSGTAEGDFTVSYTVSDGGNSSTATATISASDPSPAISVSPADDSTPGPDRTLSVTLDGTAWVDTNDTNSSPSIAPQNEAQVTVVDNDWTIGAIQTTPANATVSERGSNTIDFSVSLNAAAVSGHTVTVNYAVQNGSAQAGQNFSVSNPAGQASGTLTFAPGQTSVDVQVTSIDDGVYGGPLQFTVAFSSPQGATFSGGGGSEQATGTITEADLSPLMGIGGCSGTVSGGGVATFQVALAGAHPATRVPATVDYTTVDDSTIAGDYTPASGTISIPPGQREFDLNVQTAANPPVGNRTFHVALSNPQNVRLDNSSASCTIAQTVGGGGGQQPTVQIDNPVPTPVSSPASGSTPVSVELELTQPTPLPSNPGPVTVQWHTKDGTATAPTDYTSASGSVTWPAGGTGPNPTPVTINVNSDPALTGPASFTVVFTSTDATLSGDGTATVTIEPQGSTVPVLSIADASAGSKSGTIPVPVTLAPAASGVVTVKYATADGTDGNAAHAGVDYTATSGTLTIPQGQTSATIPVSVKAVTTSGPNRDFTVTLSTPTGGAVLANASADVTILNDAGAIIQPPVISIPKNPVTHKAPVPQPAPQAKPTANQTHYVLVQVLTGIARFDSKGHATMKVSCPVVVTTSCAGTAAFDVRVKQTVVKGKKKTTVLKTVRVANGSYKVPSGSTATLTATLTSPGAKLLALYKQIQVKATLTSKDASGAKGVTAWLVIFDAAKAKAKTKKASTTKPKSKKKKTTKG